MASLVKCGLRPHNVTETFTNLNVVEVTIVGSTNSNVVEETTVVSSTTFKLFLVIINSSPQPHLNYF